MRSIRSIDSPYFLDEDDSASDINLWRKGKGCEREKKGVE